jgi:hypothetical protein
MPNRFGALSVRAAAPGRRSRENEANPLDLTFLWWTEIATDLCRVSKAPRRTEMKYLAIAGALLIGVAVLPVGQAQAKGCIKGALVGGTAGHFMGHHGFLGAAAGCVVGRHQANKQERINRTNTQSGPQSGSSSAPNTSGETR